MNFAGNALIAKIRSIYGSSLKLEDYEELLHKHSVAEIGAYLKNHPLYSNTLEDINEASIHRGQLEDLIAKNAFNQLLRVIEFIPLKDVAFYELALLRREIDILLSTLRSIISEEREGALLDAPIFLIKHARFDLMKVMQSKSIEDMIGWLKDTPFSRVLMPFNVKEVSQIKYPDIEHALEEYYHATALDKINLHYRGAIKENLLNIYKTRIELENITKIYRLKKFYHADPVTIEKALIHQYGRITKKKMDELIYEENPDRLLSLLEQSDLSQFVDSKEFVYVEYFAQKIKYNLARRYIYFSTELPEVFNAFMQLLEIETENLTNIIEGVRYQVGYNEIKRILIF